MQLRRLMMQKRKEGVVDLSLQDVYGNPIKQSTANCYVVSKPGIYKFPCVYGNAIKNGKTNAAAYTNNGGTRSHDFVDGTNVVISSPYIEFGPNENTVSLRNYDTEDVIQDLSVDIDSGYITFSVADVPTTGANAIVTLWTDGFPIWSWHIWLWPHDLSPVTITNASTVQYNIMPVNLATKYDPGLSYMKNWFYQYGRPMPLLCPDDYNSSSNHIPGSISISITATNLYEGIQNPNTFYKKESTYYNWFSVKSGMAYNLWNSARRNYGLMSETIKTVYDPCPVGWKVPTSDVFDALTLDNTGEDYVIVNDSVAKEFEFNLTGMRSPSSGEIVTKTLGCYAVETLARISGSIMMHGWYMSHGSGVYQGSGMELSSGTSIRPVEDEFGDVIRFTINGTTYQAEKGMTWFEWVLSGYNTGGYYLESENVRYDSNLVVGGADLNTVIIEGETYYHLISAG